MTTTFETNYVHYNGNLYNLKSLKTLLKSRTAASTGMSTHGLFVSNYDASLSLTYNKRRKNPINNRKTI